MAKNDLQRIQRKMLGEIPSENETMTTLLITSRLALNRQGPKDKPRPDELAKVIQPFVDLHPEISLAELLAEIKKQVGDGVIAEVTEENIVVIGKHGALKDIPISGLKDRLSRAKKKS